MDDAPAPVDPACECPADAGIARQLDAKAAAHAADGWDAGLLPVSLRLSEALLELDPTGKSVLEAGCGRGGLLLGLVKAGAVATTGVDLSPASIHAARDRFEHSGLSDRADLSVGDAALVPLERHDWVVLDRVLCCYPDVEQLLGNTLPAALQIYAFSVPSSRGWRGALARFDWGLDNLWGTFRGRPRPGFVHDLDLIERYVGNAGFRLRRTYHRRYWHIVVYERSAG